MLALRGDPPRGEADFTPPEDGLSSAAELTGFITDGHEFTIGGACFPEVHPEADDLASDLAYLKTKVDAGAAFLITQLFFDNTAYFDFVAAAREVGIEVPIIPGVIPITSFGQVARICDLCDATIPERARDAMRELGGDEEAEALLGRRLRGAPVRGAARRRRAGNPLLRPQPRPRDPRGARRAARLAAVGARRRRGPGRDPSRLNRPTDESQQFQGRADRGQLSLQRASDRVRRLRRGRARAGARPRPADEPPHVRPARAGDGRRAASA